MSQTLRVAALAWARWRRAAAARLVHAAWRRLQQSGTITADTDAGRRIELGAGTMLAEQVSMCAGLGPGHDLGPDPVLRIGDRCVIGRGSHIVAHQSIEIGDDVWTGPYVYVTDQNHGYADPETPIGRQFPVNRPVSIGAGSWLGAGAIVLPGARIGQNVVVAAGSVVRGQVPDRCVVAGVPARVVREYVT